MSWRAIYWGSLVMLVVMLVTMVIALVLGLWLTAVADAGAAVAFAGLIWVAKANDGWGE